MEPGVLSHKSAKDFQTLSHQILQYANRGILRISFQQEVSKMIMDFSGCDGIELWVKDHDKYFRCEAKRESDEFFYSEITSCLENEGGEVVPDLDDNPA